MEITKENFVENLPKIKQSIKNADFIAIDCELTGLNDGIKKIIPYDTPKRYYEKVRSSSMDFTIIQYGVCAFRYDDTLKGFKQQCYNFYIFPTISNRYTPDHRFLCQTSSINFLVSHGFDFNKVFNEGVSYLSRAEELNYQDLLLEAQKARVNQNQTSKDFSNELSARDKQIVDEIFEKVEEFIVSNEEEMQLPNCQSSYIRRLVYNEAVSKLENRASLATRKIADSYGLFVTRWKNKESKEAEEKKKIQAENEELEKCKGFSEVIKCIVESNKLIVGHNMLLDVLHTIDKFLQKLPTDYEMFKDMAHGLFTNLLDTKYMSSSEPFRTHIYSTALPHLLGSIKAKPFQIPTIEIEENGEGYDLNCAREHEAGYDAYITGLCFLAMWNKLGSSNSTEHLKDFSLLAPYRNRLFLMRLVDSPCIYLGNIDPLPPRDHVFHLTFPKEWKGDRIFNLFDTYGGLEKLCWIDDQSAYVALQNKNAAGIALRELSKNNLIQITTYAKRELQLSQSTIQIPQIENKTPPQLKRKISINEPNVKKRKTDTLEDKIEDLESKSTYASVTANTKSPSRSPSKSVSKSKTPKSNPSPTHTNKNMEPKGGGMFNTANEWD